MTSSGRFWRRLAAVAVVVALEAASASPALARSVLFVGNSFTFGAYSPVMRYHPERVTDLNDGGVGGVPALFKTFGSQAGVDVQVSLETSPGKPLKWHLAEKRQVLDRPWDVVVLQGHSTLDPAAPGDPTTHIEAARALARMFRTANPKAEVHLVSTWSRADLTYKAASPWLGKPIDAMSADLAEASRRAAAGSADIKDVVPVGAAWRRAMQAGIADPNPYDGIAYGKVDLWTWDHYHASAYGYYLEALVVFGKVTGLDPRSLGDKEQAAADLGFEPAVTRALQSAAAEALAEPR